jgi:glycogen debranching enzyme
MDDSTIAPQAGPAEAEPEVEPVQADGLGQLLSLKDGDCFLVANAYGDILGGVDGFFDDDTRTLSRLRLLIGGKSPSRLGSGVSRDNVVFAFHGANRALPQMGEKATPPGVLHIERRRFLWRKRLYERLRVINHSLDHEILPVAYEFAADFHDVFEIRGMKRAARGSYKRPKAEGRRVEFHYQGLDKVERATVIEFSEPPGRLTGERAEFMISLHPRGRFDLYIEIGSDPDEIPNKARYRTACARAIVAQRKRGHRGGRVRVRGPQFNRWLQQSRSDIALLTTVLETGPYPYAGIPWFSTPFGRDGIITAWQMLWLDPSLAKGVLTYLARRQAHDVSAFRDSAPGKIMHETRHGEMANLNEIPFGLYYGGVDTTPLFVALAGAYADRTGDLAFIRSLWPALTAALGWMDKFADSNGDGLIDYARGAKTGLANQGWKDSEDSIFHADGRFPDGPIALVEVQGYAFAAYRAMANLGERLGRGAVVHWRTRAENIRQAVEERFWMEDEGYYGVAIDGEGKLCRPLTTNAGHLLFVGLPSAERAERVGQRLLTAGFLTGWGLRTLAKDSVRYNPMSYHNGSVWPHDTAICAAGMSRYGHRQSAAVVLESLFQAASHFNLRLPELFCGFTRAAGEPPIAYPVACMPQAWAAGSVFMVLQACLGLEIDGWTGRVMLTKPYLPQGVDRLALYGLELGDKRVDVRLGRTDSQQLEPTVITSHPDVLLHN